MYLWIVCVGGAFAFFAAMGIGANDAANAFATSVGSRSLTVKNAVVMAAIFESGGAILMGGHVIKTIRKGIADYECFEDEPYVLMYGCMWVCFSVGAWLFLASKYEMPVSTTHSCVGAMIGMTMALKGPNCVIWYEEKDTFPYIGGVSGIVASWVISPLFSAALASLLFGTLRGCLLRLKDSFAVSRYAFPVITGSCVTLNTFYIIYKGAKGIGLDDTPLLDACLWSFGSGMGVGLMSFVFITKAQNNIIDHETVDASGELQMVVHQHDETFHTAVIEGDDIVSSIHENAEVFNPKTEELFKYLQVFTAVCDSFSHGANDVANAVGPFATIYAIYHDSVLSENTDLENDAYWILALGGVGISLGLAVYGYKIIKAIGLKLCKITPSRGITIELASALVIITGSRFEIPLSTTHCQVGATIGVALLEDPRNCSGINKAIVLKTFGGWILTLVIVGASTAILVSQGAYAPMTSGYVDE